MQRNLSKCIGFLLLACLGGELQLIASPNAQPEGASSSNDIELSLVTELPKHEYHPAHLFHADRLWVGKEHENQDDPFVLDIFNADGKVLLDHVELMHSVTRIYAAGPNRALVLGRSGYPWRTHYTLVDYSSGSIRAQTIDIDPDYMMEYAAFHRGELLFIEAGSRDLFRLVNGNIQLFPADIMGPTSFVSHSDKVWVLENGAIGPGDDNLRVIPKLGTKGRKIFSKSNLIGLNHILSTTGFPYVVASETKANLVHFVNGVTEKVVDSVKVSGAPEGMAQFGKCVVTVQSDQKSLQFIDMSADKLAVIAQWNLNAAGDRLKAPKEVVVNPENGVIFVRSHYMCPSCSVTQSSVFSVKEKGERLLTRRCLNEAEI